MKRKRQEAPALLVEDDASRYLDSLQDKERRPQYVTNGLPPSPETFSDEEREAAFAIFSPRDKSQKTPPHK